MSCEKTCNMQHRAKKRAKTMQNHAMQNHVMQNHVMQNHVMPKPCKKQAVPHVAKNKLFHMSCKNHATCGAYAGVYTGQVARQATEHPLSPGSLLYVLYVLYLTRQATEHPLSPGSLLYVLYVLYLTRQATGVPCYMCYMCYMALYSTYTTDFARTEHIAQKVHIARSRGRVGVQRLGV